ncbi:histone-lysine N-methyltransferase SUVR5 [Striga asiatica]|uniref:Histone-lysine N-methyltransferase SUVR5 n=1 Tax=Striga asiatica TaxID=4170 RepID=A0A5A7Q7H8_STRAF|nr:histone-lysine N-methyltransferase SUVR5 [Striga asiatica]
MRRHKERKPIVLALAVEQCILLQCILCGSHFGNPDQLWLHVLSTCPSNLLWLQDKGSWQKVGPMKAGPPENTVPGNWSANRRFVCKFCGLIFDLPPDIGRHHQAAHMSHTSVGT